VAPHKKKPVISLLECFFVVSLHYIGVLVVLCDQMESRGGQVFLSWEIWIVGNKRHQPPPSLAMKLLLIEREIE
jgi:hypothetical protein